MDNLLETLFSKTPKCLGKFETARASVALLDKRHAGPQFITRSIKCPCGSDDLYVEAARHKQMKGVCRQLEIITFGPPVYVGCPSCKRFTLLFDPLLYGWQSERDKDEPDKDNVADAEYKLMRCTPRPGKVYVNYSYQNLENYAGLVKRGIANPEDYFDTLTVLCGNSLGEHLQEVVSSTCM